MSNECYSRISVNYHIFLLICHNQIGHFAGLSPKIPNYKSNECLECHVGGMILKTQIVKHGEENIAL
jgi:hypothetical protein